MTTQLPPKPNPVPPFRQTTDNQPTQDMDPQHSPNPQPNPTANPTMGVPTPPLQPSIDDRSTQDVETQYHPNPLPNPAANSTTGATTRKAMPQHIKGCSWLYHIPISGLMIGFTFLHFSYAFSDDLKVTQWWAPILLPLTIVSVGISFVLKPFREDKPYICYLFFQYFSFSWDLRSQRYGTIWTIGRRSLRGS